MNVVGKKWALLWLATPGIILTIVLVYIPVLFALLLGFFHMETILSTPEFAGLSNFADAIANADFWNAFVNGLVYSLCAIALQLVFGVGFALMLNERFRGRGFLRGAAILPYVVPSVAAVFVWRWMLDENVGIITKFVEFMGYHVPWFSEPTWAMVTVIVISVWLWTPFVTISVLAGLQTIPMELYESAHMDSANTVQRFWHVTLPGLLPVLLVVALLRGIWMFNKFDVIYLTTGGGPLNSTEHLPILAYRQAFQLFDMGGGAAVATLNFVFLAVVVVIYLGVSRRWLDA